MNINMNTNNSVQFEIDERERIYHFPNNDTVVLKELTELTVSESGTHYLKTKDGKLHIIPTGWIHIEIS